MRNSGCLSWEKIGSRVGERWQVETFGCPGPQGHDRIALGLVLVPGAGDLQV